MKSTPLALAACAAAALLCAACPAPLSRGARAQDAAQDMNLNVRFGRMEIAMERVAAKERDNFARRHKNAVVRSTT